MYDNCYERVEDPRGAENVKWRTEADGEGTRGVQPTEEQTVAELSLTSLLWSGAKAVAAPFLSCLGQRGATLEECEEIVIIGGEPREESERMDFLGAKTNQNGGSRLLGKLHGPGAEKMAAAGLAQSWPGMARTAEPRPDGGHGAKAMAAPEWTVTNSAPVLSQPLSLWDPPLISTRGSDFQLWPVGMHPLGPGTDIQTAPLQKVVPAVEVICKKEGYLAQKAAARRRRELAAGKDSSSEEETGAKTQTAATRIVLRPLRWRCTFVIELSEGGAGCELPVPQLRAGEQERPLCKVSPVTSTTKSEMDIGVYPYLLPGGSLVVKAGADTAMLTAEAPRAACTEPVDPGEWGSLLMSRTEPEERGVYNRGENPEPHRRSPAAVPLPESEFGSLKEEQAIPTTVVMRLPADHFSGAGKEPALTCVAAERSLVSPVQNQPERRSPTAVVTYSAEGGEDSIPSRRSGEIHPYPPQAPVVATAEEGLAQARAERRADPSFPAADVVVEEEIPLGDPSQDGGVSGSGDDVTSGGGSGTTRERTTTPRRSGSASRSPVSTQSWQAAKRAETGETQPAARPHNDTGLSEGRERVGTPRVPIPCPYAQPHALANAPVPVTCSRGSSSSLGVSEGSLGVGENRTGERLSSFDSGEGSREGGQLGQVSKSRWVPEEEYIPSGEAPKHERWSRPRSAGTSGVCSWGNTEEGDSLEWGSEERKETRWWAVGEFTPAQKKRKMQERWFQLCQHNIEPMGSGILSDPVDTDEPLSWVLPGRAGNAELTRSSRAERAIIAKYKAPHRLEYLYVPEPLMEGEIEFKMGSTGEDRGYGTDEEEGSGEEDWDPGGLHEKCHPEGYSIAALSPVGHAVRKPPATPRVGVRLLERGTSDPNDGGDAPTGGPLQRCWKRTGTYLCRGRAESRVAVQNQPERRSPTAVVTYSAEGGEDSIPSRRSGEIHPYPPQAPVVATAEEGLAQARTERRADPSLPAADVVVEEEIPLGDPSQDGGVSGSGDDVTSGGGSGTTRDRTTTPRRSGSASRSPVSTQSWQAAKRAETGETQPAARPHNDTGLSEGRERVGTPRVPIPCPYAQPHALANAPVPVTCSRGSSSSLGVSEGSLGVGENRTGERLSSFDSGEGSREGGQLGQVSKSRWVPEEEYIPSGEAPKHERWSRPRSAGTSGVCSWGNTEEGDSLEWGSEERKETRWWAVGEFTPAQKKRKMQERWFQLCQHNIEPMGPGILSDPVDTDEPLSWVLPGRAGNAELTRSSRAERAIIAKYKAPHRLEYLYVPEPLMEGEIEFKMGSTGEDRGYGTDEEEGSGEEDWDPGGLHEKCHPEGYSIAALSPVGHAVRKPP
ncbi:hypothetical protein FKM82_012864 [Ascaphus truei]